MTGFRNAKDLEMELSELRKRASQFETEIHPSFYVELLNYTRHEEVRDLDSSELMKVVETVGELALELPGKRTDAGSVRLVTFLLCDNSASDCFLVARHALGRNKRELRAAVVERAASQANVLATLGSVVERRSDG